MTNYSENVFIIPLQFETLIMKAVADTGAFSSAMSTKHFDKISRNLYQKPKNKSSYNKRFYSFPTPITHFIYSPTDIQNWPFTI